MLHSDTVLVRTPLVTNEKIPNLKDLNNKKCLFIHLFIFVHVTKRAMS